MNDFQQVLAHLKERKARAESGKYNCLALPFPRFKKVLPGFEQSKYIIITANQKIGKSKFADKMFIYEPLFFSLEHPELRVKVLYFTLEMSKEEKYNEFLSHLLYRLDNIVISPSDLRSTDIEHPLPNHIIEKLESEKYKKYIEAYENMVIVYEDIKNPTGINKVCREYAENHGKFNYVEYTTVDEFGKEVTRKALDPINPYEQDDPDEYRIVIQDNAANLTLESGLNKMQTIDKMSKYNITLRKQLKYIVVLVQHQAQAQEGIENIKLDRMKPTTDGLADCKTTSRDANMVIGLYNPYKYGKKDYEHYDMLKLRNYVRFMEVLEDRDYGCNGSICPLFFNGASSDFQELPLPTDLNKLRDVYDYINHLEDIKINKLFLLFKLVKNKLKHG